MSVLCPYCVWCCRAERLAEQVGAYHMELRIDSVVSALLALFSSVTKRTPRFRADGGSNAENLAMQNIQVTAWHVARCPAMECITA